MAPPSKDKKDSGKDAKASSKDGTKDAVMTDSEDTKAKAPPPKPVDPITAFLNELKNAMQTLDKAVSSKESRFMSRVIRQVTTLRRMLGKAQLLQAIDLYVPSDSPVKELLISHLSQITEEVMQVESTASAPTEKEAPAPPKTEETGAAATETATTDAAAAAGAAAAPALSEEEIAKNKEKEKEEAAFHKRILTVPEAEIFVQLLVTIYLLDQKALEASTACSSSLIQRAQGFNRRTLDQLLSKGYFYWARSVELTGRAALIRNELLGAYRTAVLKHDQIGQATLLNLLLRNYLEYNLYEQADTFMRKTTFPEGDASNNQLARYLYYTGRIKAVQLEYTDAFRCLQQASRKAPQQSALGFRKTVHKFSIIVQLLLGEIPDRSIFSQKGMIAALKPYLHIAQAVRVGDLGAFHEAMGTFGEGFKADKTYSLIVRLRHNVIKTGLKKINLAYSHISLADVCAKLRLESAEDTAFIVAKAIQDGVIDATIDHSSKTMVSKANLDVYSTAEPQAQFHKRIAFCLDMHNQAVKAMRYADNTKAEWESAEERRERLKQEEEMMNAMEEDDDF